MVNIRDQPRKQLNFMMINSARSIGLLALFAALVSAECVQTAAAADSAGRAAKVYLQVSSSQNPVWADELSQKLRAAGLPAAVLKPARSDEAFRVVLGPYATREQAEETGRGIGMPSFVVTTQDPQ